MPPSNMPAGAARLSRAVRAVRAATTALALLVVPSGCDKIRQKVVEKAQEKATEVALEKETGQKVDIKNGGQEIHVDGAEGKARLSVGEAVRLPDDFPKEIPVYPGSKLSAAMSNDKEGNKAHVVVFEAPDKVDVVSNYYKANLKGFKQSVDMTAGPSRILQMSDKKNHYEVALVFTATAAGTNVQLTAGQTK